MRRKGVAALSENAIKILERRYLKKDENDKPVESPEQMFWRVAKDIAEADALYGASESDIDRAAEGFYEIMARLEFLPNSPTLRAAGRELRQLSACFVLPIEDRLEDIFDALKYAALIHKTGGGVGFSFSKLRPHGDRVSSTGNIAGGPVSFMKVFNAAAEEITQGGVRMGANIGILSIDHPDIIEFVTCKKDGRSMSSFNISVAVTDSFMEKVKKDEPYNLINPRTGKAVKKLKARKVFDLMASMAWQNGDPGILFIDRINEDNPTPALGRIESTNPCGEQPLLPYESCNLGSINLLKMLKNGEIDREHLRDIVHIAVHFLDNVIDRNEYVIKKIEELTKGNRKIGLGVMGFADVLLKLGIPYDSEEALKFARRLMKFISDEARRASADLARKRGPFPNLKFSIYADSADPPRNATRTTIAPTGTISIIAGCSSGIEPVFAFAHKRKTLYDRQGATETLEFFHPILREELEKVGLLKDEIVEQITLEGSLQGVKEIPAEMKRVFVTALDISPQYHIKMQSAFQEFTDNAVSKTVNMPNSATVEEVRDIFMMAYKLRCKGITIYRDGSREEQVLEPGLNPEEADKMHRRREEAFCPDCGAEIEAGTRFMVCKSCGYCECF